MCKKNGIVGIKFFNVLRILNVSSLTKYNNKVLAEAGLSCVGIVQICPISVVLSDSHGTHAIFFNDPFHIYNVETLFDRHHTGKCGADRTK